MGSPRVHACTSPTGLVLVPPTSWLSDCGRGGVHLEEKAIDDDGASSGSALPEIGIEVFAASHPDILVGLQRPADVDDDIRGRGHLHLGDTTIGGVQRKVGLSDQAQRHGATMRLAVVHHPLLREHLDAILG